MKLEYKSGIIAAAVGVFALSSCATHDPINEVAPIGQAVPTVYWEVGSTVCPAGESFSFQGKYTVEPGHTPLRSEVWYQIERADQASASAKLAGSALSYTQSVSATDTMRNFQSMAVFPHNEEYWDGHEYVLQGTVPVSRTLSPINWTEPAEWDQAKFDTYFPEGFKAEFLKKVYDYLTLPGNAGSYYTALRNVYLNYAFTNEQFAAVGLPSDLELDGDDNGAGVKSDTWFATTDPDKTDAIIGKYYITLDENGKTVYNEVGIDYVAQEGQAVYNVYAAAPWVFCRYDDNTGTIVSTVREEWLPKFRTLLEVIPFEAWLYDSSNTCYKVEFSRNYVLRAQFRAYDTDASGNVNEGVTSNTDLKEIKVS